MASAVQVKREAGWASAGADFFSSGGNAPVPLLAKIGVYSSLAASSMNGLAYSRVIVVMPILRAVFSILALARRRWKPAGHARIPSLASLVQAMGTSS